MIRRLVWIACGMLVAGVATADAPANWCCRIVGVNTRAGVVMARNNASGKTFLFAPKDKKVFGALKRGTAVNFTRRAGISVQGQPGGFFKPLKPPKGGGGTTVEVDCSITPELCRGHKPGEKIDMIGTTTWEDVIDYCYDEIDNCFGGPN